MPAASAMAARLLSAVPVDQGDVDHRRQQALPEGLPLSCTTWAFLGMEHQVSTASTSPEDVWRLFVDLERWPGVARSMSGDSPRLDSGPLRVGSQAIVRQPGLPAPAGG